MLVEDSRPLIYDYETGDERIEELGDSEVVATRTHLAYIRSTREVIIEYNHRGAKATDLIRLLNALSDRFLDVRTEFELTPVVDRGFIQEVDDFERILNASVTIARPNPDWTDWADHLADVADASDGQQITVNVSAGRGGSLDESNGVMAIIRGLVASGLAVIKTARVEGYRMGEEAKTSVSLSRHVEHQSVEVDRASNGAVDSGSMEQELGRYAEEREHKDDDDG